MEVAMQARWRAQGLFEVDMDCTRRSFFVTFAIPYVNGALHMGHAFTLSKAIFAAGYQRLLGACVLFPQGFHASGTPIPSAAQRVAREDPGQVGALLDMGVRKEEVPAFGDPTHWVHTFAPDMRSAMEGLGAGVDWRRSFVTAGQDPKFESFVEWQFGQLHEAGLLRKGEKLIVFSPADGQPCSDHDRAEGEGARPVRVTLLQTTDGTHLKHPRDSSEFFARCGERWVQQGLLPGLNLQGVVEAPRDRAQLSPAAEWVTSPLDFYEPEARVLSRSGDECVVARVPQWYIDYEDAEWKRRTLLAIDRMDVKNACVRDQLADAARRMLEWGCSRSRGLGTRLPVDRESVIDSLSDSTLYMAYYTVAHRLSRPLRSHEWNAVLLGAETADPELLALRQEHLYWYPLDLRVSGKDLLRNHLPFCVFHHVALLGEAAVPRAMWCNGHLLLDGRKMAKSTGNFMTLSRGLERWGADAVRLALAYAGDGIDDANFERTQVEVFAKHLASELRWLSTARWARTGPLQVLDRIFLNSVAEAVAATQRAYECMHYRAVVHHAWWGLMRTRDSYIAFADSGHADCLASYVDTFVRVLAPIIPHLCEHVWARVRSRSGTVLTSGWPAVRTDARLSLEGAYLLRVLGKVQEAGATGSAVAIAVAELQGWQRELQDGVETPCDRPRGQVIAFRKFLSTLPESRVIDEHGLLTRHLDVLARVAGNDVTVTVDARRKPHQPMVSRTRVIRT